MSVGTMECSSTTTPNVPFPYTIVQHIPCSKTAPRDAVVTKQGRNATQHVEVRSLVAPECPASFPRGVQTPSGNGVGEGYDFFVFYMDGAVLVAAIPESSSCCRCLQASVSLACDHFAFFVSALRVTPLSWRHGKFCVGIRDWKSWGGIWTLFG